jgi:hypothetical protein
MRQALIVYVATFAMALSVAWMGCNKAELRDYRATAAAVLVLDDTAPPAPAPAPSGKCTNCNGTGKLGDGTISVPCPVCGGDGLTAYMPLINLVSRRPNDRDYIPPDTIKPTPASPVQETTKAAELTAASSVPVLTDAPQQAAHLGNVSGQGPGREGIVSQVNETLPAESLVKDSSDFSPAGGEPDASDSSARGLSLVETHAPEPEPPAPAPMAPYTDRPTFTRYAACTNVRCAVNAAPIRRRLFGRFRR